MPPRFFPKRSCSLRNRMTRNFLSGGFLNQTAGRIRDLRVEMTDDSVLISGRTSTYYVKQLATQIALEEVAGCDLQNVIEVI